MADAASSRERHNELAPRLAAEIVKAEPGDLIRQLVILESVVVGVISEAALKLGGDEAILEMMLDGAGARLRQLRLAKIARGKPA
jgi:hypothetical protein